MTNKTTEPVAVPEGWKLVPLNATQEMWAAYRNADSNGVLFHQAYRAMLSAAPTPPAGPWESPSTPPAQPTQADMNAAIDRMRRENNLGNDSDNAYKRDLLDCVIGALAFGKQGSAPPPEDHWLHQVWEIGDAERMERDSALPAQQSQWVPVSARLPQLDIPVWLFDEERGLFMGMRISSTDGWLWAECTFYRFFGSQWESIEAHFDDFEPSHWMPLPSAPGDTAAPEQAEQQCQQCAGTGYDCPDCIHAAEQDAVKVPRGLLECYLGSSQKTEFKAR